MRPPARNLRFGWLLRLFERPLGGEKGRESFRCQVVEVDDHSLDDLGWFGDNNP